VFRGSAASVASLPIEKGIVRASPQSPARSDPYDQLADLFEANLDMEKILSLVMADPSS
jgi:cobyric acid synthase